MGLGNVILILGRGFRPSHLLKQCSDQFDYCLNELDENGCKENLFGGDGLATVFAIT